MEPSEFEKMVGEEFEKLPEKFRDKIKNVALLIEDEPSEEVRREEGLADSETLLGIYHGIPNTERGSEYGVGATLPDTITIYRKPIEAEARDAGLSVRQVVYETLFHEVAHYFGMDEDEVRRREGR